MHIEKEPRHRAAHRHPRTQSQQGSAGELSEGWQQRESSHISIAVSVYWQPRSRQHVHCQPSGALAAQLEVMVRVGGVAGGIGGAAGGGVGGGGEGVVSGGGEGGGGEGGGDGGGFG